MTKTQKNTGFCCRKCWNFTERDQINLEDIISEPIKDGSDVEQCVEYIVCPHCGELAVEETLNFRGISKINKNKLQTGPNTEAGKAKHAELARIHLNGPKTQAGKDRVSKNAFKHGKNATVRREFAPASYDKYPFCEECSEEIKERCKNKKITWCPVYIVKQLEIYGKHVNGDVEGLSNDAAKNHAKLSLIAEMMMHEVFKNGAQVTDKKTWEGGSFEFTKANPLIEQIVKVFPILGHTSDQQRTNPRMQDDAILLDGFIQRTTISDELRESKEYQVVVENSIKLVKKLAQKTAEDVDESSDTEETVKTEDEE